MSFLLDDVDINAMVTLLDPLPIDDIRHAIAVQLLSVSGIGQVYEYEPFMAQAHDLRRFMAIGSGAFQKINGWTIMRARTAESRRTQRENDRLFTYMIRGYYGVSNYGASELYFQQLVDLVCDAFRNDESDWELSGTCEYIEPPQVLRVDHVLLVGTLCHFCEIQLVARTQIDW